MKKIIIGLLLLAVSGGVVYYLLSKKTSVTTVSTLNKELLIGKWKLDTAGTKIKNGMAGLFIGAIALNDSNFLKYEYDIQKEGKVITSVPGSVKTDTSFYEWADSTKLNWIHNDSAKTKIVGTIIKLDSSIFSFQANDSTIYQFNRMK